MTIERIEKRRRDRAGALPDADLTPRVRALVASLTGEVERLRRDLASAEERLEQAERVADQDHLLPVLNRRAFVRALAQSISVTARYGTPASLIYFDLDGFKRVNDVYGHAAGDAALAHFARLLAANVRGSDIVGRLGGDEFGVVLVRADVEQARKKAAALLDALTSSPAQWNGTPVALGFSHGVCELVAGETAEDAIRRADEAMYARKRGGGIITR